MNNYDIQNLLIKINGIRVSLKADLEDLQGKRGRVAEKSIHELEYKIGRRETEIKDLDSMELLLRSHLT